MTVVVDFGGVGGGIKQICDPAVAATPRDPLFSGTGFALDHVPPASRVRLPGQRASGRRRLSTMPPTDAYWGLFWSDGESGDWVYSSESATG